MSTVTIPLTVTELQSLFEASMACKNAGMSKIIFYRERTTAANDALTACMIHDHSTPLFDSSQQYPHALMGISRVPTFVDRLALLSGHKLVGASLTLSQSGDYYATLEAKTKIHTLQFRFADPTHVERVPKQNNGKPLFSFDLTKSQIDSIAGAARAYSTEFVWLHSNAKGISADMVDPSGDKVTIDLGTTDDIHSPVSIKYDATTLLKMLAQKIDAPIKNTIYHTGVWGLPFQGSTVFVLKAG